MRTSTFKRNWMLHYIQPEYLYLPRKSEQPEPHPAGTTRVYFRTNNFGFVPEDGSGIILAVYDNKGKIIFCSHYKNNQGIHLYSEVYYSAGSLSSRKYYYKIISTPYISTSYTIDSNDFLILPPGQYYYRYIRDAMQYAEIERYKLYSFTIPETESTGITSKIIDIDGLSREYLNIITEVEQKDSLHEENAVLETDIYDGEDFTYYRARTRPSSIIPPTAYLYLKYNIVLDTNHGTTTIKTIDRGKISRANYREDAINGWGTGKEGNICKYYLYYINSIRESLGKIQDYWVGRSSMGNSPLGDYRGGIFYESRPQVIIGALRVIEDTIDDSPAEYIASSIVYDVQHSYFTIYYTYQLPGYYQEQKGNAAPTIISSKGDYATWDDKVDAVIDAAFRTYDVTRYKESKVASVSSNIPTNVIIGVENSWEESGYYITARVETGIKYADLVQDYHEIVYNFEIDSVDTSLTDGYEAIMFDSNNWDLRNKKLNKNFYRYYNNGQDIPFYNV